MDKMKSLFLSSLLVVVSTSGLAQNPMIKYIFILPMMRIILPGLR